LQGSTNGHDVRKNNNKKARNDPLEYLGETNIQGGTINYKNMKNSSAHQEAQEKVHHPILMKLQ
jgi:hypothetical protein